MVISKDKYLALPSAQVLPFVDGIFAVAFTLMAYSIPEELNGGQTGIINLVSAVGGFLLGGIAVVLYWFKMRRLVQLASELHLPQIFIGFFSLLTIVALPKMSTLALRYGQGAGSVSYWTTSQTVNSLYLGILISFDLLVLLFALSLLRHQPCRWRESKLMETLIRSQGYGLLVLLLLGGLELLATWFNAQYIVLVPIVLIAEEVLVAHKFARG